MAKGHKGKKAMVKERTRKLSNIEKMKVDEGSYIINEQTGHLKAVTNVSAGVLKLVKAAAERRQKELEQKQQKLEVRQEAKKEMRKLRLKMKLQSKIKKAA